MSGGDAGGPRIEDARLTIIDAGAEDLRAAFARDVRAGLTASPKRLSCVYFYDHEGSRLFDAICGLPEYYLTRAEREIFERHADEIAAALPAGAALIELGSGSAAKTRLVIEALLRRARPASPPEEGAGRRALVYVPVDVSPSALRESTRALLADYPTLTVHAIAGEYEEGLRRLARVAGHPALILWLGSSIGNLDRDDARTFLGRVRAAMAPEDRLLVGIDLRKDRAVLEPAYDDAQGVTARFNRNLLARINRELGGRFDLGTFAHRARYDAAAGRIEMYLVSTRAQRVAIDALGLTVPFEAGEAIHTENSYKYSPEEIASLFTGAGLRLVGRWLDGAGRFSSNLCAPAGPAEGS